MYKVSVAVILGLSTQELQGFSGVSKRGGISLGWAAAEQIRMAVRVRRERLAGAVLTVAGADVGFTVDGRRAVAGVVVMRWGDLAVLQTASAVVDVEFGYVPGLLSFREAPAIVAAARKLKVRPDVLIVDGQGLAHPRRFGLACHVGVELDWPTVGCAKSRLIGDYREPGMRKGCACQLKHNGEVIGSVLRSRDDVKPLYVSVGHRVTLEEGVGVVLRYCRRYRICEPIRAAHRLVSELRLNCDVDR